MGLCGGAQFGSLILNSVSENDSACLNSRYRNNFAWCLSVPGNQEVIKPTWSWNIPSTSTSPHSSMYPRILPSDTLLVQINSVSSLGTGQLVQKLEGKNGEAKEEGND